MGSIIRSKAMVLLAMQITLVTLSPAPILADDLQPDISKRDMCKMWCSLKCYPETSPLQPCILACMTDCMGKPSAISGCNLGCVMASCLSNADPADTKGMKGCAEWETSCSEDCKASYIQH